MQNFEPSQNIRVKEQNFLKLNLYASTLVKRMAGTGEGVMAKNVFQGEKKKGLKEIPKVSFERASDDLIEEGVTILASLSSDGAMSPEVECMAAEFKEAIGGEIDSVVSPMLIKLTGKEGKERVKLGTLEKIKSVLAKNDHPFYRIDRLKIMYLPLFSNTDAIGEEITFSINDSSIKKGTKNKTVSKVSSPLNKMSMVELYCPYFVPRGSLAVMEFGYKTGKVPVQGRAFAFVCLSFYIQRDYIPITVKVKQPIVLLIEDLELPKDINRKSLMNGLVKTVNNRIAEKKEKFEKKKERYEEIEGDRRESMRFIGESYTAEPQDVKIGEGSNVRSGKMKMKEDDRDSAIEIEMTNDKLLKENIAELLPRRVPFYDHDNIILDTGAPSHWFYNPNLIGLRTCTEELTHKEGEDFYEVNGMEVKLGSHWLRMKKTYYARKAHFPLISYKQLVIGGIVDSLISYENDTAALCKNNKVIFNLECDGHYMVFKKSGDLSLETLVEM